MAKINVYFGTMNSGKSLDLIRAAYNYKERGMNVLVYKPDIDTREGLDECIIKTRVGMELKARWIDREETYEMAKEDYFNCYSEEDRPKAIVVDESQFLSEYQINEFQRFSMEFNIPIIFYGLKVDFTGRLFKGSKRLLEIADRVVELIGICHCGQIARQNARVINGEIQKEGDVIAVGGNEMYVALCNECFTKGRLK